ncbi:MAG: hypothetical protein BGO88_08935 [Flavobacterium sp. 38-13]|nr:MAG: hypothetical protein BGO88_08935 [Flavobacterium sp. 38-13]
MQCPYKVTIDSESFTYSFTTKNGIEYNIIFSDSMSYFSDTSTVKKLSKIYSITIDKVSDEKPQLDTDVELTIDAVITHFFKDIEKSIVYYCYTADHKERSRARKFNAWYTNSPFNINTTKIDNTIEVPDDEYHHFTSIIYHKDNPFSSDLTVAYYEMVDGLTKPPKEEI